MKKTLTTLTVLLVTITLGGTLAAQQGPGTGRGAASGTGPQVDSTKVTSVAGDVIRFTGGPGQGMPTLVLNVGGQEQSFVLGSYRYLAAQKFAPAAGDRLQLTLWACASCPQGSVVAEIQNVRTSEVLKLRAADGSPLFAGPQGGRGMRGAGGHGLHDGTGPNASCPNANGPNPDCPYGPRG
ncbi:MAG TPA: hypothetical protein PLB02_11820 [Thermoanaerobaculia bacterium]|nr:hypothetical protein [Thermoanaerobaculia bacterium]HQR68073.1 hypothetical protein [Thermoanaerobaculia bacterium]